MCDDRYNQNIRKGVIRKRIMVAHAFGSIDGYSYTNSLEAFKSNYAAGHRVFEVDLYLTRDKKVVCAHDWIHNAGIQRKAWTEQVPPTEEEFKAAKILDKYTPISYVELLQLMKAYSDIWIITDTKYTDKQHVDEQFRYMVNTAILQGMADVLERFIIQIYNEEMYNVVNNIYLFENYIFTMYQRWNGDIGDFKGICTWCVKNHVRNITMPIKFFSRDACLMANQYGICIYVHTVNNVLKAIKMFSSGVCGIYTDSLKMRDLKIFNVYREKSKQKKQQKRYKRIINKIIRQEEMVSCVKWIRNKDKAVVIFGAGTYGHQIYDILKCQGIGVAYFCDNNKYGCIDEITGIEIVSIDTLRGKIGKCLVLLCVVDEKAYVSIERQLNAAGFSGEDVRGMREYIDSLTVENLEIPVHRYDYLFAGMSFLILSFAFLFYIFFHNEIILMLVLFLICLAGNSLAWIAKVFDNIELKTILYQIHASLKGMGHEIIKKYCLCVIKTIIELMAAIVICQLFKRKMPDMAGIAYLFLIGCGIGYVYKQTYRIGVPEYFKQMSKSSQLYENEYVAPASVKITFPEKKKNLICIYLESMEMSNAVLSIGNLIPKLTQLTREYISFSNTQNCSGMLQMPGTGWTMAGILSSMSGISYILPIEGNAGSEYSRFLPKLESLGDILEQQGYSNYFMCGSDAGFAGRDVYFKTHGNYEIYDLIQARNDGVISEKYHNGFWGMEDAKLYEYAKIKLMEISKSYKPFNFTMLTVDTHHTEGYICSKCPSVYASKYANVISCADNQVCDFLDWIKKQEWYKDTVVVIIGDHLSMVKDFYSKYFIGGVRTVYNCFINTQLDKTKIKEKSREFWMADLFPTIVGALGANIEGERLGLGVNMFSNKKTLAESIGKNKLFMELSKGSMYYKKWF